jgi:sucrose phosphorylase
MRNQVQLITYADRLGGSLGGLAALLDGPLKGLFGGVHVLPFFWPYDGADAGFDPADHTQVDPRLGSWADILELSKRYDVLADLIVNHVSTESDRFDDVRRNGASSPYFQMFLTFSSVFPDGATEGDLLRIFRPRPGLPFTRMRLGSDDHLLWTTFTDRQVDIDVHSFEGARYLASVLQTLADNGVTTVRVDAAGYAVKKAGTSCFMMPETFAFIDEITVKARALGMRVLVEIHGTYDQQLEVASHVDCVYDFALPPLILHALLTGEAGPLRRWLGVRPSNATTVLDTHDGIGIVDIAGNETDSGEHGLLTSSAVSALVESIHRNSADSSRQATGAAASNLDLYQVNCTYYDALARDDRRYLLARLIQLFTPGVPQVYYVGLLAGSNDMALLEETGVGRDVNRHHYTTEEVSAALQRPVVQRLAALMRFRNTHPAFGGEFSYGGGDDWLELRWAHDTDHATLLADLSHGSYTLRYTADGHEHSADDVAALVS